MLLGLTIGCVSLEAVVDQEVYEARLTDGTADAVAVGGPSTLVADAAGWTWLGPGTAAEPLVGDGEVLPRALAELGGDRFVLTEHLNVLVDRAPEPVGVEASLSGEIRDLCADGTSMWLETDAGTLLWRSGVVYDVQVGGSSVAGPVACGGTLFDEAVAWVGQGSTVHAVAGNGQVWRGFESRTFDGPVDSVAVDRLGGAWVVSMGELHERTPSRWRARGIESPVRLVLGGPWAGGVWAITDSGPLWVTHDVVVRPTGVPQEPELGRWQADALGRLVLRGMDGVVRYAMDRPAWLDAPPSGSVLVEPTLVRVVPTAGEMLETLTVTLAGRALPVEDHTFFIDPSAGPAGEAELRIELGYPRHTTILERTYQLQGPGSVTWADHVEPIHAESCAVCHTGSADTLLRDAADWQSNIADIIDNVDSGAMPLGGPALPAPHRGLIRAWRDGGFP